jgi:competence ComEA-like helix-hairpin-helix protein
MNDATRKRLYATQQRLALTGPEASVLLGLVVVLVLGFGVRYLQASGVAVPPAAYAELDAAIAERAERSVEELRAADAAPALLLPEGPPPVEASAPVAGGQAQRAVPAGRLGPVRMDLNAASAPMLERLPGIGPALAGRIVEYRDLHGPFRRPEDLVRVRGIGPKTYEKLAPYLYVE